MNKQQCPICGEFESEQPVKNVPYTYRGVQFYIDQPQWCGACGEGIINAKDNKVVMLDIQSHKARIDGLLTPVGIKDVKKKIKIIPKRCKLSFWWGGVNAFNRYEGGVTPIPKPLSLLLTVLNNHPGYLQEIKSNQSHL